MKLETRLLQAFKSICSLSLHQKVRVLCCRQACSVLPLLLGVAITSTAGSMQKSGALGLQMDAKDLPRARRVEFWALLTGSMGTATTHIA